MATSRRGTVLVVDDEEIMREILDTLLSREGYDVRVASSGAEGLELARSTPFDAAIVDIMMPGLDGIATLDDSHFQTGAQSRKAHAISRIAGGKHFAGTEVAPAM